MREFIGLEVLANTVSMLASNRQGAIWISDCDEEALFYEGRCAHPAATVLPAPSMASLLISSLRKRGLDGVLATVPPSTEPLSDNEFSLACGSVTSLLVFSGSCLRLMEQLGGRSWYAAADIAVEGLLGRAAKIARILAAVRNLLKANWLDRIGCMQLIDEVVVWETFSLRDAPPTDIPPDIWLQLRDYVGDPPNALDSGDEMLVLLSALLKSYRPRGIRSLSDVSPDYLLAMLRTAYDINEFEEDRLYWDLRAWERVNNYPLLRNWRLRESFGILLEQRYWDSDFERFSSDNCQGSRAAFKLDLDNFKLVNEALTHAGGDEALCLYSRAVRETIGSVAEIYRRGGDEIVAFAPSLSPEDARRYAEALRREIEDQFQRWGSEKGLQKSPTASIGLVISEGVYPKNALVEALDKAQGAAKATGKNRVVEIVLSNDVLEVE